MDRKTWPVRIGFVSDHQAIAVHIERRQGALHGPPADKPSIPPKVGSAAGDPAAGKIDDELRP